jgi:hypothetical protein
LGFPAKIVIDLGPSADRLNVPASLLVTNIELGGRFPVS